MPSRLRILAHRVAILFACATWSSLARADFAAGTSVYYDFNVVARSGTLGFTGFGDQPSVNDFGRVAFVGQLAGGENVYTADGVTDPTLATSFLPRTFGRAVQINNRNQVLARDSVPGSPPPTFIRYWNPDRSFVILARGGNAVGATTPYRSVFAQPSFNDDGEFVFSALKHDLATRVLATEATIGFNEAALATPMRPMMANDGRIVVRAGSTPTSPINIYNRSMVLLETVANTAFFTQLGGSPGISDDGGAVAFFGNLNASGAAQYRTSPGPGVFLRILDVPITDPSAILRVARRREEDVSAVGGNDNGQCESGEICIDVPELGRSVTHAPLAMGTFDADTRIGVARLDLGVPGVDGDAFVVTFLGTPTAASRPNPHAPGRPFTFSAQRGLWSVRVDVDPLLETGLGRAFHVNGIIPVVQIRDTLGGATVTGISVHDPVANAAANFNGSERTMRRGDHFVAFWASTTAGQMIVRGRHIDSDTDGLLDHWEQFGLDMNADGTPELDLRLAGANPQIRDLFVEADWLEAHIDHAHEPWNGVFQPFPGDDMSSMERMFAEAPRLEGARYGVQRDGGAPDAIPAGIDLHVDAGPGTDNVGMPFSLRMGSLPLHGGDAVIARDPVTFGFIGAVYRGAPGSRALPGLPSISLEEIKSAHLGDADMNARELVFRYVFFADQVGILPLEGAPHDGTIAATAASTVTAIEPLPPRLAGHFFKVTTGTCMGLEEAILASDASTLTVSTDLDACDLAGESFALLSGNGGIAEAAFYPGPDNGPIPGNDVTIGLLGFGISNGLLGSPTLMWRDVAHEVGHTLGLRHGGNDHEAFKGPLYLSLMCYSHALQTDPASDVNSFADAADLTFDDFADLRLDFAHAGRTLGAVDADWGALVAVEPGLTIFDVEALHGPIDLIPPAVTMVVPAAGASVPPGGSVVVRFTATDARGVARAAASLDLDGDGVLRPGEAVTAAAIGADTYEVTLGPVSGPEGARTLRVIGMDPSMNQGIAERPIDVSTRPTDTTAPVIDVTISPAANAAGWHASDVTIAWSVDDPESGIASSMQCETVTLVNETPSTTITCEATNGAGLTSTRSVTVKIDKTAPTISGTRSPMANAFGWNNVDVTVDFTCSDALSGIDLCDPATQVVTTEGGGQSRSATARDLAGNEATATVADINIDKTAPAISGARSPMPNAFGWNNVDVTVDFTCSDALSGIDLCDPRTQVVTTEGAGQSRSATARDRAGNEATATVGDINIDKTAPRVMTTASPATAWPPNHELLPISVSVVVEDDLSGSAGFVLLAATSSEPDDGRGDGRTSPDIEGFDVGTADVNGMIRAERSGGGVGRVYELEYEGRDRADNVATGRLEVRVEHDRR